MEQLWPGGPLFKGSPGVFPLGTDAILLPRFACEKLRSGRVLDLGCGSGILTLLSLWGREQVTATAVDLSPDACRLAEENLSENGLLSRCEVLCGDLRDYKNLLPPGAFDLVIANPPYFPEKSGYVAGGAMATARSDGTCTPEELCAAGAWAARWGGRFCLVYRPELLPRLFSALEKAGFSPKRLLPVHHSPGKPVNLVLLEARRGGGTGLRWEKDLYLFDETGSQTPEARAIYHRDAPSETE